MSRLIGIVCCAYSGSTWLSSILDGLPGVQASGEDHVLTDTSKLATKGAICRCGDPECSVFSQAVAAKVVERARKVGHAQALLEHLDSPVVVSSNKARSVYTRLGMELDGAIHLWKDPRNWVLSWGDRRGDDVESGIDTFNTVYQSQQEWLRECNTPTATVCLDEFVASPEAELQRICQVLNLEYRPEAIPGADDVHHHCRGNNRVAKGILKDRRWTKCLTDEEAEMVMSKTEETRELLAAASVEG